MGVNELTRCGFGQAECRRLAHLIAECVKGVDVKDEVARFRKDYTEMKYCFNGEEMREIMGSFAGAIGL